MTEKHGKLRTNVLITRPTPAGEKLGKLLQQLGFNVLLSPMMTIASCEAPRPAIDGISAVMFTSKNAVAAIYGKQGEIAPLISLPCFCVGCQTSEAANKAGFNNIITGNGDGLDLASAVQEKMPSGSSLLHIRGKNIKSASEEALTPIKYRIVQWQVYKAEAATEIRPEIITAMRQKGVDIALFFSPRTAEIFASLVNAAGLADCCSSISAIAISRRVADALEALSWEQISIAKEPSEKAMTDCLTERHTIFEVPHDTTRRNH